MKKMLIMLSAVLLLAGGCGNENKKDGKKAGKAAGKTVSENAVKAEELINYVPANTDGVISVDADRVVNLKLFKDLRKENAEFNKSWVKFESELQQYGLKITDLPSKLMMFFKVGPGTQDAGVLAISNKITEAKLVELLKASKADVSFIEKTIAGRKAYVVTKKAAANNDKVAITYIKENLVLLCDEKKAEQYYKVVGKTKNEKLIAADKKSDKKALVNLIFTKEAKAAPAPAPAKGMAPPQNPADTIKLALIALNLVGKNQKDISLKADLDFVDKTSASNMAGQLNMGIMIMSMQFAQDTKLVESIKKAIKIDQKEKNVKVDISVSEALMKKIQAAMEAKKKQAMARAMAPAPTPQPVKVVPSPVKITAPAKTAAPATAKK